MSNTQLLSSKTCGEFIKQWISIYLPSASLGSIAKKCTLSSKGALHDILSGRSKASLESIQKISQGLKITGSEKKLLLALWQAERSQNSSHKIDQLKQKIAHKSSKIKPSKIPFIEGWDYVLAILNCSESGTSLLEISKKTKLSRATVNKIITTLISLNLVEKISPEYYRATALHSFFESDSFSEKEYLLNRALKLKKSIQKNFGNRQSTLYRNNVFSIRENRFPHFREKLKNLLDEFIDEAEESSSSELVELFFSFEKL